MVSYDSKGLVLKIEKDKQTFKGFTTYKRVLRKAKSKDDSDIKRIVQSKFPIKSKQQCRLLDYNHLMSEFICSFESSVFNQAFSDVDLVYGNVYQGKISKIENAGVEIRVGKTVGFIPNLHITIGQFSENIKKKLKVDQKIKVKYFEKHRNSLRFTLKQSLLESDKCLSVLDQAKENTQYPGIVVKTAKGGVLVAFYGGIKGWLPKKFINDGQSYSPSMFYEGQTMLTTIHEVDGDKITLTLDPPKPSKKKTLQVGQRVKGLVKKVEADHLVLEVGDKKVPAVLPCLHLTYDNTLAQALLKSYKPGVKMENLIVIAVEPENVVSLREGLAYFGKKAFIPMVENLEEGIVIRCSYVSEDFSGILVYSPVKGFNGCFRVFKEVC